MAAHTPADLKGELATITDLHEFIEKVRAAAGISPLGELMPSVPSNAQQCLIAKNLGAVVSVAQQGYGEFWPSGANKWRIEFYDRHEEDVEDIARTLGLESSGRSIELPERIGNVAEAFDGWNENPEAWPKFDEYIDSAFKSHRLGTGEPVDAYDVS